MSSSTPVSKVAPDADESPSAVTPRQHRHRHRHHDASSVSPDASNTARTADNNNNTNNDNNNYNSAHTDGAQENPLIADASRDSVASSRSRNRRSRRSNQANRTGAAFDLIGDGARNGLTLCCDGVSVQRHHRDVIDEVSCLFRGGRVTAVVNCCGTHSALALLAALAGRVDCAAGNILMNGVPVSASTYQAQMSFVEEKDALTDDGGATSDLFAELTVRENLEYASKLRVANSAQAYSVEEMLQQLLLEPHADARIRDCTLYVRRRVALGKELLLNPSVLLLDEPMDGLATHEAQQFLTILSKLAAPSAADAEARHVMREAMSASAAASFTSPATSTATGVIGAGAAAINHPAVSSTTPAASTAGPAVGDLASPPRVSLYTPRHSRIQHHRDSQGSNSGFSPAPSSTFVPPSPSAVSSSHQQHSTGNSYTNNNSSHSRNSHGGAGLDDLHAALSDETQRVMILSIVQPRWALLQYVHDVVLLERSRCVFAGSVQEMLSVKLPKAALRPRLLSDGLLNTDAASTTSGPGAGREEGGFDDSDGEPLMRSATQVALASPLGDDHDNNANIDDAPADSYDAVAASIRKTRLNEEFLHGLYRLATSAVSANAAGGIMTGTDFPEFGSFTDNNNTFDLSEPRGPRSPSGVAVRADGNYTTPLSQLYSVKFGHTRAQVTAYMEVCAAGLLSLPEASHQPPSSFIQLLYLFRFGFVELRHNLVVDLVALVFMLAVAAALAAIYGVQVGERGIQNCAGILFFLVCLVVLQAVLSLDAQRREYAAFYRYSRSGYYAAWSFLVYRAVTAALWRLGLTSFVALVVFVLSNFGEPWREYRAVFELGLIMAVLSYCCYFLIWFLCSWWPSDRVGRFIVFTFYTFNIVLGGLVLNLATLPTVMRGVSFLSVMRLAYESAILTHFADKTFGCEETPSSGSSSSSSSSSDPTAKDGGGAAETRWQLVRRSADANPIPSAAVVSKAAMNRVSKGHHAAGAAHGLKGKKNSRSGAVFSGGSTSSSSISNGKGRLALDKETSTTLPAALQGATCYTGADYASYLGFEEARRWPNVGILVGMSMVLLFASWLMMVLYRPRRRLKANV